MKLIFIFLVFILNLPAMAQDMVLEVEPPTEPIYVGDNSKFRAMIVNRGGKPVTLVQPGDGSNSKMRTPVVGWSILSADEPETEHPKQPPLYLGARCGNINPIRSSEVFTLKPGERQKLSEWTGNPRFDSPGRFRIRFYYQNIPKLPVSGIPLGKHDAGALKRMEQSHPCEVVSEEIIVTVLARRE